MRDHLLKCDSRVLGADFVKGTDIAERTLVMFATVLKQCVDVTYRMSLLDIKEIRDLRYAY